MHKVVEIVIMYLCLMITCWSILLGPKLRHYGNLGSFYLSVVMADPGIMLIQSNLYTMVTILFLVVPRWGLTSARPFYDWLFVLPYVMHCLVFFGMNLQHYWLMLHSEAVLEDIVNGIEIHVKLMILAMVQVLSVIESVTIMYFYIQKKYRLPTPLNLN